MFTINSTLTDLKVKDRNIFKIIYSMNSHPVATPEMSVEEARCYILFFSEGTNLTAFIGLYLPSNDRKFFYAYTSNPFPFEAAADVETEARQFAEDMGFLLDEISVGGMAVEDRNHWIEDQYIFGYKKPELPEEYLQEASGSASDVMVQPAEIEEKKARADDARDAKQEKEELPAAVTPPPAVQIPAVQEPVQPASAVPAAPVSPSPPPQPPLLQQQQQQGYPAPPAYPHAPQQPYPQQYQQPHYPPQQGHPYAPQQPYPGYPHPGYPYAPTQPYPGHPQPMPTHYPPMEPPQLDVPELGEPEEPSPRRRPAAASKPAAKKKPPPQPAALEEVEEELPVKVEMGSAPSRPRDLMQEAIRQGVVKPPKPKAQKAHPGVAGTVARDKEALARLLSSF